MDEKGNTDRTRLAMDKINRVIKRFARASHWNTVKTLERIKAMTFKYLTCSLLLSILFALPCLALDMDGKGDDEIRPTKTTASSVLSEPGFSHDTSGLYDYDWSTDWTEGAKGAGYGEELTFTFTPGQSISGFSILPGFRKSEKLFYENAAPTVIRFTSGSFTQTFNLTDCLSFYDDAPLGGYWFSFSSPLSTDSPLTLTILSIREGSRYEDCVLTELHFIGQKPWSMKENYDYEVIPENITASSVLYEEGYDHGPWKVLDADWSTGWTEGTKGTGEGESLTFRFRPGTVLTGISLLPGYWKSEKLFWENAAPLEIRLSCGSQGTLLNLADYVWEYKDLPLSGTYFSLPSSIEASSPVTLTVLSVREGSRYEDCVLTEAHFFGYEDGEENTASYEGESIHMDLSEDTLQMLLSLSQLLYNYHTDYPSYLVPAKMSCEDLTSDEKAFALYWILYHRYDKRAWEEAGNYTEVLFYPSEAKNCMQEAFQSASSKDLSTFLSQYSLWQNGDIAAIPGTGDFGSAYNMCFENGYHEITEGGSLCLRGSVSEYQAEDYSYLPVGTYSAYFSPTGELGLSGWQFECLFVE